MKKFSVLLGVAVCMIWCFLAVAAEPITFDFSKDTQGWIVPDWCLNQADCVAKEVTVSTDVAETGSAGSLKVDTDFPGNKWAAALVEYEKDLDLKGYKSISADVYLPKECKSDLMQARIVVTAGNEYFWIEIKKTTTLTAGKWTRLTAPLDVSEKGDLPYWQCKNEEVCLLSNLDQVKKVAVRIEYNASPKNAGPPYKGPVYIDNIVIE